MNNEYESEPITTTTNNKKDTKCQQQHTHKHIDKKNIVSQCSNTHVFLVGMHTHRYKELVRAFTGKNT